MGFGKNYYQGDYKPTYPKKYVGKQLPHFRSGWERRVFYYMDMNERVVCWSSEPLPIPYFCPLDNSNHNYWPDIFCRVRKNDGTTQDFMLEIKPMAQAQPAKQPKRMTGRAVKAFNEGNEIYIRNASKWEAATKFCNDRHIVFKVVTEKDLNLM